jgi:hypothetical protein
VTNNTLGAPSAGGAGEWLCSKQSNDKAAPQSVRPLAVHDADPAAPSPYEPPTERLLLVQLVQVSTPEAPPTSVPVQKRTSLNSSSPCSLTRSGALGVVPRFALLLNVGMVPR